MLAIALDRQRKLVRRPSPADPGIEVAGPPVVGGDRVRPIAISSEHACEIGAAQCAVFNKVEAVAAADIGRRGLSDLHRPLGPARLQTPHTQAEPVARFSAVYRERNAIEIGCRGGAKRPASATYEEAPLKIVTDRFPEFAKLTTCIFMTLAGRTCPGVTTESPRMTLTGFAAGSAKAMISAASAFSALGFGLLWFFVDEPPRTTFTAPQPVSGKLTSWTLPLWLLMTCSTVWAEPCRLVFAAAGAAPAMTNAMLAPTAAPA